jgi:hypothetical protein
MIPEPSPPEPTGAGGRPFPRGGRPAFGPGPGMIVLRIAVVTLGLVIGVVLLSRGDVVLGLLLVAFAVLRGAMFLSMRRRRAQWRAARAGRRP